MIEHMQPNAEAIQQERIAAALQEAEEHIRNNITPALDGRKCVDGRYEPGTGQIARAGGDMGYVEILLALNARKKMYVLPEQCFDMVYEYVTKDGGSFNMHTDTHADPDGKEEAPGEPQLYDEVSPAIGCGHCAKPTDAKLAADYGLNAEEVKVVIKHAKKRRAEGDKVEIVKLHGDHAEQGTLIVESDAFSINASAEAGQSQYFIYDKKRDVAYMKEMIVWLQAHKGLNITELEFMEMSEQQTNATLKLLAENKPVLQVVIDNNGTASEPKFLQFVA